MGRYSDWSPLGEYTDPTPGDPDVVAAAGTHYANVADAIADAKIALEAVFGGDEISSVAMDALSSEALQVADRIGRAKERYAGVAEALTAYAPHLREAQRQADELLATANGIGEARSHAYERVAYWEGELEQAQAAGNASAVATAEAKIIHWNDEADATYTSMSSAISQLAGIVSARNTAADSAADAIEDVESSGDLNDGFWDNVDQFFEENPWVDNVMTVLAVVGAVLAVVALFVPGLNLIVIALTIAVLAVTALQVFSGNKSPQEGLITLVLTLLPFGIGKLAGRFVLPGLKAAIAGKATTALVNSANGAGQGGVTIFAAATRVNNVMNGVVRGTGEVRALLEMAAVAKIPMLSGNLAPSVVAAASPVNWLLGGFVAQEVVFPALDYAQGEAGLFDAHQEDWSLRNDDW